MGAKTKFSASEAADAMNYMAMAGWKTEDMLSGVEGIMNLGRIYLLIFPRTSEMQKTKKDLRDHSPAGRV